MRITVRLFAMQREQVGAKVVAIDGNFDQALEIVRALGEQDDHPVTVVNSINPYRLEGQKTGAFEVCDDLGRAPEILAIPVGNAGNITATWRGYQEYRRDEKCFRLSRGQKTRLVECIDTAPSKIAERIQHRLNCHLPLLMALSLLRWVRFWRRDISREPP